MVQPKTRLAVDVSVAGAAAGEQAFVTLAAVDEAVLRMTDFADARSRPTITSAGASRASSCATSTAA